MLTRDLVDGLASAQLDTRTLLSRWESYARPVQIIRPEKPIVEAAMGRGTGKTRLGNEHTLTLCENWGPKMRGLVASKTERDTIETLILGEAGLLQCARGRGYELEYLPGRGVILHPSGAQLTIGSGEVSELGRGLTINYVLADELKWWKYAVEAFANIRFALRAQAPAPGRHILVTSTPSWLCKLRLDDLALVQKIRGRTQDNRANLAPNFIEELERTYKGHPLADQEMGGLDINLAGALVTQQRIHDLRVTRAQLPEEFDAIRCYVDPGGFAIKNPLEADPTGIVVLALADAEIYVLAAEQVKGDESVWAPRAAELAVGWRCGLVKLETNQGGAPILNAMARALGHRRIPVEAVVASKSKLDRALPAAQQYELGHMHHVGVFPELESELTTWGPKSGRPSPNLLDALAHGVNDILPDDVGGKDVGPLFPPDEREIEQEDAARGWARDYFAVE